MPERSLIDQIDSSIQDLLAGTPATTADPDIAPLIAIARELVDFPRENFRARLKSELERKASMSTQTQAVATQTAPTAVSPTAIPRLRVKNAPAAIEFYKQAFGAREIMRFAVHGQIAHAELAIGNSTIMLGEEAPEYGFPGPAALGGSPVSIRLSVDDADAVAAQAVAAGGRLIRPVSDQFYGDRSGLVTDPFGYTWDIAMRKEAMSAEEMHRRFEAMENEQAANRTASSPIPQGFHTITPYPIAQDAAGLIDFLKQTFGAEETFRTVGSAGGIHAEVRVGDSMVMIGGGGPGLSWRGESQPMAFHVYVEDTDAVYQRALAAGAVSIQPPADQVYGERSGSVKDFSGNYWYIATYKGDRHIPEGLHMVTPYLHPRRAEPLISFLKRAFGAEELEKYPSPDGVIHHAKIKIGDSALEMGEAQGPYQPMPSMFYLYVPNVDAVYLRALNAGATSTSEPADQSYGDRTAAVKDVFGYQWYIATHIRGAS
jgi:PhnB protein